MPSHWLHVYERPTEGTRALGRFQAFRYRHKISAAGGFDTASCELALSRRQAERFLRDYLGCRVAIYVDNPFEPIWEGFINRAMLNAGAVQYTRSLDELYNRVSGIYTDNTGTLTHITAVNNTTSQAVYGIKEASPENWRENSADNRITTIRDTILAQQAYPQASVVFSGNLQGVMLRLELKGWYHVLDWVKLYDTDASQRQFSAGSGTLIEQTITTYPNTDFFDVSDLSLCEDNTRTSRLAQITRGNITYWGFVQKLQESGDGSNLWVAGITPTNSAGVRRFYFKQANTSVDYILRAKDGIVRDIYGRPVKPWAVQPDRRARINDILFGLYSDDLQDPRTFYVDKVDYDAERGTVQLASSDDINAEGAFKLRRKHKTIGQRFGVEERTA